MITSILFGAGAAVLGLMLGWYLRGAYARFLLRSIYDIDVANVPPTASAPQQEVTYVDLFCEHDQIYAHDRVSGQFLGQAASVEDLAKVLYKRFPNKVFSTDQS